MKAMITEKAKILTRRVTKVKGSVTRTVINMFVFPSLYRWAPITVNKNEVVMANQYRKSDGKFI